MVEIHCIRGQWRRNDTQWVFDVDSEQPSTFFEFSEALVFEDLFKMIVEDFDIEVLSKSVQLSYGLQVNMRLIEDYFVPVFLKNDRHLLSYINKSKEKPELIPLCVTVSDRPEFLANSRSIIQSKTSNTLGCSTSTSASVASTCTAGSFSHGNHQDTDSHSSSVSDGVYKKMQFKNKDEMMLKLRKWALDNDFEFRSVWSNSKRVILHCVDDSCPWRLRATKLDFSDIFEVKKINDVHTCDLTYRNANHRQATAKLLGTLVCSNYGEKKSGLNPKQIMEQVQTNYGVHIDYKQAWRVKEVAENLIRGTPEDSYANLSKWLYQIEKKNPGTKVFLEMEPNGKFKFCFLAFGQSLRGFDLMRRVIAIDGTFLKGKYNGTLLGASAQDGDFSLYPLAFGIVDSENERSWTWFLRGLKLAIPDASDLVFVSDRANAISKALANVYPLAHHGICRIHLIRNLTPKYGGTGLLPLVESAANAYTEHEFSATFKDIERQSPNLSRYLKAAGIPRWARSQAPANRYNIMTTNIAESLNSLLNLAREMPVICLLETIRMTLTSWFLERRTKLAKHRSVVSPNVVKKMGSLFRAANKLDVYQVDDHEFEVKDKTKRYIVHLGNKECSCLAFNFEKIPCLHAIAAAKRFGMDVNNYVDEVFLTKTLIEAYSESIHPVGDLSTCDFPDTVSDFSCAPPTTKQSSGRPPKKRKRSAGEFGVPGSKSQGHKCSRCNVGGHNKKTCKAPI